MNSIVGASHQQAKKVDLEHAAWETRTLTIENLDANLNENLTLLNRKPPVRVFSTTKNHRHLKLSTHLQVHNTDTPAKFQGPSPNITPFNPHMCGVQEH